MPQTKWINERAQLIQYGRNGPGSVRIAKAPIVGQRSGAQLAHYGEEESSTGVPVAPSGRGRLHAPVRKKALDKPPGSAIITMLRLQKPKQRERMAL